jgi:phosphoesterase RecJ-like protein
MSQELKKLIDAATKIVIIQADNPDGDSLASALALEQILGDMGKEPLLYCGTDIPTYLQYLPGWDRVNRELPHQFDLSIIVDCSAESLLANLDKSGQRGWVASKPCIIIDHHDVEASIPYATLIINEPAVSTGELIYELAQENKWSLSHQALTFIAVSIMADSRGLTTDQTTARSIHIVAELVDKGVSIPELETARRKTMQRPSELVHYKGKLLQRAEYHDNDQIAVVAVPWAEIEQYSHAYNPTMLVMDDMLLALNTKIAIGFKHYPDGKVTAKIRANYGSPVAGKLAEHFGGGGHVYAAGFKVQDGRTFTEIKNEAIRFTTELLATLQTEQTSETL